MNTLLFIIYTFVALVCLFQVIILTCEATRQKHQIEELQGRCKYLFEQIESLVKIADKSSEIDHLVKDRFDNISDTLDLYEKLVDSLNDGQAQLNLRVQQLEMLNSNVTLTDKYDPLNPSKVFYDTNTHVECHAQEIDEAIRKAISSASILDLVDDTLSTTSQQLPPEAIHFTKED